MSDYKIKKQEIDHRTPFDCPFCGQRVLDWEALEEDPEGYKPCKHTLFIGHDEGIDYRSSRLDAHLGIAGVDAEDIDLPEHGFDGLTDQISIPGSVKYASYVPAPSFFGTYVCFAPTE